MYSTLAILAFLSATAAIPFEEDFACKSPSIRQEWRQLSRDTRQSYLDSVRCLKTKPSRLGLATSLYDDFPYVHAQLDSEIHFTAVFLPWHRYFLHLYEEALQGCGYDGISPYWDWTLDVSNVSASPIWDTEFGFGANGFRPNENDNYTDACVHDGPFKYLRVEYTKLEADEHCLEREWNDGSEEVGNMLAQYYTPEVVTAGQQQTDYDSYRVTLENGPHGAIHSAIGGDMSPSTSPNDPIFFLHHGQIDRLWSLWQAANVNERTLEYSGLKIQRQLNGKTPSLATIEDLMPMLGLALDVPVREYMSTQSSTLCYRY